jgi:putative peptidoglycan lipid II flippase
MNLLKSTGIIGGMTLISRVFGFVRDMMLSRLLGGSAMGDAWQIAFQLPNIFRRLFAEGAFSAAFVPLFNRHMAEDGERDHSSSQRFANETLSVFLLTLLVFSALIMALMPWVIWLIDDFGQGGRTTDTSIALARICFPYLALVSVMTLFGAILNSISRFAAVAFAPVLMNLCMIGAMLLTISGGVSGDPETVAFHLAWSVTLAGVLQMLWLYWHARRAGFRFTLLRPRLTPDVRQLGVLILPAVFGAGIYQISRFVDLFFLGRLEEGSFVFLALADRLNQLPLGIIGIALGTAILPALSRFIAQDDAGGAQRVQSNAIELGLLLTVPAAVGLYCAAQPLVSAFYFGGKFGADDVAATSGVVAMLVVGLPAYVLVKVLTPGFFARRDTKTPVYTALAALAINIGLNLVLIPLMGVAGLALAGAIAAWVNCALLYWTLHRRGHFTIEPDLLGRIGRIMVSAAAMGLAIWQLAPLGAAHYGAGALARVGSILALVSVGGFVYFALAWLTGAIDRSKIAMLTRKQPPTT